jgi:cytochrome c peroxidase
MQPHWHIWDPKLSDEELDRLVDFLQALSDETFSPEVPAAVPSGLRPIGISPLAARLRRGRPREPDDNRGDS